MFPQKAWNSAHSGQYKGSKYHHKLHTFCVWLTTIFRIKTCISNEEIPVVYKIMNCHKIMNFFDPGANSDSPGNKKLRIHCTGPYIGFRSNGSILWQISTWGLGKPPTWITKRIKRLHQGKRRAFNSYKKSGDPRDLERFHKERKDSHKETRKSYRKHIASVCSDSPPKFWSFIKSLKVDTMGIPTLKRNGRLESNNKEKAAILNDQFKAVFTKENKNSPHELLPCQT